MSYYGYERLRPGDALGIDMSSVTEQFGKDLNAYKKKKDDEVTDVAEANRGFAESLAKMPSSFNDKWNTFFGDTSNNAMKGATQVTDDFNKGVIDKRTFDIRMANLNSSVSMTVESMTKIAAEINKYEELSAAGKMNAEDQYKWSKLQKFADLGNVSMVFDPEAYTSTLIKVNPPDIAKGTSSSYEMMNINQFYNGVNMTPGPMYDTNAAITNTLNSLGGVRDITTADGKRTAGKFLEGAEGDEVVSDLAQAMLGQSRDMRLFAMGNTIIEDSIEGADTRKVAEFDYAAIPMDVYDTGGSINQEKFKKLQTDNPYLFYEDQSGRFYESDKARELILKNAGEMLRGAADYTEVETPDLKPETNNELRLAMKALKDVGYQPSVEIARASLRKAGFSEEEVNSFTGEMIKDDKDDKKNTTKLINSLAAKEYKTWFPEWLNVSPPEGKDKFEIQDINRLFRKTPFEVRKGSGGVIQIFYEDSKVPFYDFGQKQIRVFKENMSPADEQATLKGFKDKLDGKFSNNDLIQLMLQVDKSIYTNIVEKVKQAKAANSAGSSTEEGLDYSNL